MHFPITHVTLYKHGVGFFVRQAAPAGTEVALSFPVDAMNDVLKSLTVLDRGEGKVLGIDYATPESEEERLAGNTFRLDDRRSMRDLIVGLRGRQVRLLLDQEETWQGTLIGADELPDEQPLEQSLVSLVLPDGKEVRTTKLARVRGLTLLDENAVNDLRFFLEMARGQETQRPVTIRLTQGEHDLVVSYVAPAPTWRVSYRLLVDTDESEGFLLGWGIFDNRIGEDLNEISLSLVAGMPISFIYDLYTPFTPERPEVEEAVRVTPGAVEFERAVKAMPADDLARPRAAMLADSAPDFRELRRALAREELERSALVATQTEEMGELFRYDINTPVTVGRGKSAMVPIISTKAPARKDLIYNGHKMPKHPVACLRLTNDAEITLERGPVTVVEDGEYVGEAVLPFTVGGAECVVPYSVALDVTVRERSGSQRELRGLRVEGAYAVFEEWDVRWREFQVNNSGGEAKVILVEHERQEPYRLFDSPETEEISTDYWRFKVEAPPRGESTLRVQVRRLVSRREQLEKQSYAKLQEYLRDGLMNRDTFQQVAHLLRLWEQIEEQEQLLAKIGRERELIYAAQEQIRGNMQALDSGGGAESALRARYVRRLEEGENRLETLTTDERQAQETIEALRQEIGERLAALAP
jgi:hypothetical protein